MQVHFNVLYVFNIQSNGPSNPFGPSLKLPDYSIDKIDFSISCRPEFNMFKGIDLYFFHVTEAWVTFNFLLIETRNPNVY